MITARAEVRALFEDIYKNTSGWFWTGDGAVRRRCEKIEVFPYYSSDKDNPQVTSGTLRFLSKSGEVTDTMGITEAEVPLLHIALEKFKELQKKRERDRVDGLLKNLRKMGFE